MKGTFTTPTFAKTRLLVLFSILIAATSLSQLQAQISGVKNIPGDYADLATAITDLNTVGVGAGGVTLNLVAGNPQTAPAGGYSITTLTGTAANPIILEGNSNTITANAALTAGALNDAIFKIVGSDWVTINGFTMQENAANTITTAASNNMTEWGVGLFYTTTTDGAQNCTIQNNTISLNRTYQNTFGVYSNSTHTVAAISTSATATGPNGGNHNLLIRANSISNVNLGIVVVGPTAAADQNLNIVVGGNAVGDGNTLSNYGTTGTFSGYVNVSGTVYGVLMRNSVNYNISRNSITSSNGGTIAGTLRGIYVPSFSNAPTGTLNNVINNNTLAITHGLTSGTMQGITVESTTNTTTSTQSISNNNFTTMTYSPAGTGTVTIISTAVPVLTLNVNNNTFTNLSVNTTGSVTFISHGYSMTIGATQNFDNNSIVTGFTKLAAGGTITGLTSGSSSVNGSFSNQTNNNFSNITVTGATAITGINNTDGAGTSPSRTVTGNTFSNWSGGTTSAIIGMTFSYIGGPSSTISNNTITNLSNQAAISGIVVNNTFAGANPLTISNNTVNTLTSTGTGGAIVGISCSNASTQVNIHSNKINTLSSTGASAVNGITVSGATSTSVYKNKIYDLAGSNASSTVNGILVSSGTLVTVHNNIIGDLRTPAANAANPLIGLSITGGTTVNAYYNTVHLNASSTGALFGCSAVSVSTTPTVTLRNNIFVNGSTPTGATGFAVAYRRSSTTLTSYAAASNNNLFYAGVPGANNLIFYDGTNADQTLAAYKTRVNPRDANSVTENPPFISTVGANANFLHINTGVATQVESSAANIAGITDDFDNVIRQGNPGYGGTGTAPDMGADEGDFILLDLTGPIIAYTALLGACGTSDIALTGVTISDGSGVPTTGGLRPRIYYKKGAGAYFSQAGTLVSGNGTNGSWDFTMLAADMGGLVVGDVISYYIVAQDIVGTPNISSNPGGVVATDVNTIITHPAAPNTATVQASLSGTYTVGVGGNYTTLKAAVDDYNTKCLAGPVVFSLIDGNYPSEVFPISINQVVGVGPINTLTIKPAAGVTATISGSASSALIVLNGADYVILDGSNGNTANTICPPSTASRDLTITQTNTGTTSAVVWLQTTGSNAASNNTIQNLNLVGNSNTTTLFGAGAGSNTISITSLGNGNNNNAFINNNVSKVQYALYSQGASAANKNTGNIFNLNLVNTIAPNNVRRAGVYVGFENNVTISGNNISGIESATTIEDVFGITFGTNAISTSTFTGNEVTNAVVANNIIGSIRHTNTYSACGIFIAPATSGTNRISNNTISGVSANGTSGDFTAGILMGGGAGSTTQIYYNTISMSGTQTGGTDKSYGLAIGGSNPTVDVRNNIFVNTQNNGTGNNYAIGYGYSAFSALTSDNNDFFVTNGATWFIGSTGSISAPTNQATLANLQAATGKDGLSTNVNPVFASATDLHLVAADPANAPLLCGGKPVSVTTDIDCSTRGNLTPTIGADEIPLNFTPNISIAETSGAANNDGIICIGASVTLTATGGGTYSWSTGETTAAITVSPTSNATYTVTVNNGSCAAAATSSITVNPSPTASIALTETSGVANNDGITCAGATVQLTVTGVGTYLWSVGGFTTQSILVAPLATTTYSVIVTNNNNCTATASVTITVNPLPTATITVAETSGNTNNDGKICDGASATLTAAGGTSFAWSTGATTAMITVSPMSTTTYTVAVTNGDNCTATAAQTITVDPIPTPSISVSPNDTICSGTSATLTATGGDTYSWSTGETTASITVFPAGQTTYTVTAISAAGCTKSTSFTVATIQSPSLSAVLTQPSTCVANDGAIDLTAFGTYNWATPNGSGLINGQQDQSGLTVGIYNVTVTNFFGCTATASYGLSGPGGCDVCPTIPTLTASPSPTCQNVNTVLTASGLTSMGVTYGITFKYYTAIPADPYVGGTVIATVPNGSLGGGGTTATTTTAFAVANTYFVYAVLSPTPADPACRPAANTTLVVNATPAAAITETDNSGNLPNDGVICAGATATLTASGGTNYVWSTGVSTVAINVTPASDATYTVTVTNAAGCTATATSTIIVNPLPTPAIAIAETSGNVNNDGIICNGASVTLTASGGTAYAWSTGANTAGITVSPISNTTYTVTVTNANGCTATASVSITVNPLPIPGIAVTETSGAANNDGIICNGATATLTASGGTAYLWSTNANTATISVSPVSTTTYTVTVTNANGCSATMSTTITVNPIPDATATPAAQTICSGNAITTIALTSLVPNTTFNWTRDNVATVTGIAANGAGNIVGALTNLTNAPITVTFTITPTANGCTGAPITATVLVNPTPTAVATPAAQTICSGNAITTIVLSSPVNGATYSWIRNNTVQVTGIAANGAGNISGVLTNTTNAPITVTFTITPTATNCPGPVTTATVLVNPSPALFILTGGGVVCNTDVIGVPVGLSGSQLNVNYQLRLNGNPIGAPVAGTGAAISFGPQLAGTYTVLATHTQGACTTLMTGTITIGTFNCSVAISDPCVCKNNATTLTNGQFGETIKVNAPDGQIWTVSAINGLYSQTSPLPPANPFPLPVGTNLLVIGGNMYTLTGIHIDAIGYTISVTNNRGTTLSIGNTCEYPNPSITTVFPAEICLFSDPIPLVGNPGDANIVSQTFRVNGVVTNTFNPAQGTGAYTIVYTVDGGVPKAFGPNDPGCLQSVSTLVNVVVTPTNLVCNDQVYVSLDADCTEDLNPDDVLEGTYLCFDDYILELDKNAPFGNGPWLPGVLNAGDIGKTYQVRVTHLVSGNKCWGQLKVEDKLAPTLTCENFSIPCTTPNKTPGYLTNTLQIAAATPSTADCQAVTLTYIDTDEPQNCATGLTNILNRKWTATDASGNTSTCLQLISLIRPTLADVVTPPDYDDIDEAAFSCEDNIPHVNGHPLPSPDWIEAQGLQGYPHVFGEPTGCTINWEWHDFPIEVCDGTIKYRREWTLVDWCIGDGFIHNQIIKVLDETGPAFVCPPTQTVSTDPFTCCATVNLPDLIVEDNCSRVNNISGMVTTFDPQTDEQTGMYTFSGTLQDFPGNNHWDLDTLAAFGSTPCLPIGTQKVLYIVEDDCGNSTTCQFNLKVEDQVPPVAACDQFTTVGLTNNGDAEVHASTFDNGSYDNCCLKDFTASTGGSFRPIVTFDCNDVGDTLMVTFRVTDCNGNTNDCMVLVEVQDKIKPTCLPPAHVTVNCENFDPSLWAYGIAEVDDNCCLDDTRVYLGQEGLTHIASYTLFDTVCNKGTITRTFRAFDCHGLSSQCTQRVVVTYEQDYFVKFPNDAIVTVCDGTGLYGEPTFFGEDCELLGVSYEDEIFTVVPDACFKIERNWQIINWCTYNPNAPCIEVPNPNPNPISNAANNLPGPTVSACGTIAPWAPTSVRINPTDAQPTNFCTFYNKDANCYKYKQIIKIIDGQAPTGTYTIPACDNQNWLTANRSDLWNEAEWWDNGLQQHDLCEEPTDLCITATDACSGSNINIEYLLFLDLDNDGTMETVVNSVNTGLAGLGWNNVMYNNLNTPNFAGGTPRSFDERAVPFNQKYGFSIQETVTGNNKTACVRWNTQQAQNTHVAPELPHGTHKIKWNITDGCGNNKEYEYSFTVKDCKAPTVVCLNGLSVNIMPMGMIQLWASDFLQYTEDNCTPSGQLKIGIRKCGTGTGFPYDANGNPITNVAFTCAELGTQCVELWSVDAAGNADYCETYVIVQDNLGNCGVGINLSGALKTENAEGVEEAIVHVDGTSSGSQPFSFFDLSDANGVYQIMDNLPVDASFVITPEKDDNPLNGVTTYDLVLISKHILGIEPLNTPYKMIAADANKSGSITTFDIVEIRKLILGIYNELPNNTSWRFVDKSFAFPNANNPFQTAFPETISIANVMLNQIDTDFAGVKIGDVNNTAVANVSMEAEERTVGTANFDIADRRVKAGEQFEVTFKAAEALKGFQFTMLLNGLKAISTVNAANVSEGNFNLSPENAMAVSIDGAQSFTVRFRAEKSGKLSEMLDVSGSITRAEAYAECGIANAECGMTRLGVALRFNTETGMTTKGLGFELYQNQPNPFVNKTFVGFYLPQATEATLSVFDESGRVVYQHKGQFAKGENSIQLDRALINTSGLLYYKLETATDSDTKKMIQMR